MGAFTGHCQACGIRLGMREMRTVDIVGRRVILCMLCFLKLPEKDRSNRDGKRELREQALYEQLTLPF